MSTSATSSVQPEDWTPTTIKPTLHHSFPNTMLNVAEETPWTLRVVDRSNIEAELAQIRARLADLAAERQQLQREMAALEARLAAEHAPIVKQPVFESAPVTNSSPSHEKVHLFRSLFAGRSDVFPVRWENRKTGRSGYSPACANEWVRGICGKPKMKCGECLYQKFIPPDESVMKKHLRGDDGRSGDFVAGVYPLLSGDTCWFLAADFDKASWAEDANALLETCREKGIPAALERSRSGNGGHVWIFFSEPVSARLARQLGSALITETMERRPEIGFASYDRLFPNQDTMPLGGFGNLIALPLQNTARKAGNSVFVDTNMRPYDDQWAYLSSPPRMSGAVVADLVEAAELSGQVLGVRMPVEDEQADEPWKMSASRRNSSPRLDVSIPRTISRFARFSTLQAPMPLEWLTDNGSAYTAKETRDFATALNLIACFTPVQSPESNGISESFVKTFKRDNVRINPLPDAVTALGKIAGWFEDYKMKPLRQIEAAEMMIAANRFTMTYATMILSATRAELLLEPKKPKPIEASAEDIARMEREMEKLYQDYRTVQDTLGDTMLILVVAKGYVSRLLRNNAIMDYLRRYHTDMTGELEKVMEAIKADAMSVHSDEAGQ